MHDLLYTGDFEISKDLETKIKTIFPEAKTEISYDDIHENRLSVELPETKRREYLKFIIKSGYEDTSFYIQMTLTSVNFNFKKTPVRENLIQEIKNILIELEKEPKEVI